MSSYPARARPPLLVLAGLLSGGTLLALAQPARWLRGEVIGGGGGDFPSIAWGLWRVAEALPGLPTLYSDLLFFPTGARLLIADLPGALAVAPITRLLGAVAAFSVLQVAHVVLAAVAGTALARDVVPEGGTTGALLAGLALGLSPVLLSSLHNGNPDVTPVFVVPLAILCLRRLADPATSGWGWAAGAGLSVGLAPWLNPYVGVMAALAALVAAPWRAGRAWAAGAVALLLAGGYAALTLASLSGPGAMVAKPALQAGALSAGAAHLQGFFWPDAGTQGDGWSRHLWLPGATVLGLALLGLRRAHWRWGLLAGLGVLLSLGPVVQLASQEPLALGGVQLAIPLAALPILSALHIQYRFAALTSLGLGLLAASGAARLGPRGGALALLLVLLELSWWGAPLVAAGPVPASVRTACGLLDGLPPGPVLDLPGGREELRLLAQTCHGRPVAEGINQPYPHTVRQALARRAPFAALAEQGFRLLVLHTDSGPQVPASEQAQVQRLARQAEQEGRVLAQAAGILVVDLQAAAEVTP